MDLRLLLTLFAIDFKVSPSDLKFVRQLHEHSLAQLMILTKDDKVRLPRLAHDPHKG